MTSQPAARLTETCGLSRLTLRKSTFALRRCRYYSVFLSINQDLILGLTKFSMLWALQVTSPSLLFYCTCVYLDECTCDFMFTSSEVHICMWRPLWVYSPSTFHFCFVSLFVWLVVMYLELSLISLGSWERDRELPVSVSPSLRWPACSVTSHLISWVV